MAEQHDIMADVVADRASATTDPVRNLRTGVVFTAEIDGSPDALTIASELGEDYRNIVMIHVADDDEAAGINQNDLMQFTLFGRTTRARILKRRDNPANVQNEFWAECQTAKDAT